MDRATPPILAKGMVVSSWARLAFGQTNVDDMLECMSNNSHITDALRMSEYAQYVSYKLLPERYHGDAVRLRKSEDGNSPNSNICFSTLVDPLSDLLVNPLYSPLMASDVSKLPPTFVLTGELDVLRDDGMMYARRLADASVDVKHVHRTDGFHGMFSFTRFNIGQETVRAFVDFIKSKT
jgi:acetyl esterase/lipase